MQDFPRSRKCAQEPPTASSWTCCSQVTRQSVQSKVNLQKKKKTTNVQGCHPVSSKLALWHRKCASHYTTGIKTRAVDLVNLDLDRDLADLGYDDSLEVPFKYVFFFLLAGRLTNAPAKCTNAWRKVRAASHFGYFLSG